MNGPIRDALEAISELATLIYQGNDAEDFVSRERCLFLADQVNARVRRLQAALRRGRLPEATALRDLSTEAASQARLADLDILVGMAYDAAADTAAAIVADDFRRARQRVSEGVYVLWQLDEVLAVLTVPGTAAVVGVLNGMPYLQRKEAK